jgi:hypothetical protein
MVKIDVEGHEHAVIEGGRSTIERDRPFIIIEILGTAKFEVINTMLIEASYIDIALSPAALRHCLTLGFHSDAWNHLLCRTEKAYQILALCRELNLGLEFA